MGVRSLTVKSTSLASVINVTFDLKFKIKNPGLSVGKMLVMLHIDLEFQNKYTPASENRELKEEVMKIPGMSQVIFDKGIAQGAEEKQKDNIRKLAEHLVKENPGMAIEQATDMAKIILK